MPPILRRWGAAAVLALAVAGPVLADPPPGVTLSPDLQRRLGVTAKPMAAARHVKKTDAFAKVLDPEPLVQLASDLATAEAAARASAAEAKRARALQAGGAAMAAKDAEAAIAQAESDALHVDMLRRRLDLEWGPGVARMNAARRQRLIDGLTAGKMALVHVDTHNNDGQAGAHKVEISVGADTVPGVVLGPARAAEPRLQSSGLLVEVDGPSAILLSVGLTQSAEIDSPDTVSGVELPRSALVRLDGGDWVYVRVSDAAFERRRVDQPEGDDGGLFVATGVKPGDQVVVQGAAALLAAETGRGRPRP